MIIIATSLLMLNACGGDEESETKTEEIVAIDTSNVQVLDEINTTTVSYCILGEELVRGGENDLGPLDASQWTMTLDSGVEGDLGIKECLINGRDVPRACIQVDPQAAGTGMYQDIDTEIEKRYRVRAELLGADNYLDKYNYNLGRSYISIEDHKPLEKSQPIAYSEKVTGDIPKEIAFDFDATKTTNYISLRGDTAFRYPTAFKISVKELIQVDQVEIEDDNNASEENNTSGDKVPCNL